MPKRLTTDLLTRVDAALRQRHEGLALADIELLFNGGNYSPPCTYSVFLLVTHPEPPVWPAVSLGASPLREITVVTFQDAQGRSTHGQGWPHWGRVVTFLIFTPLIFKRDEHKP